MWIATCLPMPAARMAAIQGVLACALAAVIATETGAVDRCTGDCDLDGAVALSELLIGVHTALSATTTCRAHDRDGDDTVTVDELVESVDHAQQGCPLPPTSSPTSSPSATETTTVTPTATPTTDIQFVDITAAAGLAYEHSYILYKVMPADKAMMMGGVAAGDYDDDGWIDLYTVGGDDAPNRLFRNLGNSTFADIAGTTGLAVEGERGCGPTFADYDGDGRLDLFIGGIEGSRPRLYRNHDGDGSFVNVTTEAGLDVGEDTFSAAFGDYDRDGFLDLIMTHWGVFGANKTAVEHLWHNNRNGTFTATTQAAGLADLGVFLPGDENNLFSYSFTPNFADINNDGWLDLLVAADFGSSRVFLNQRDGSFTNATTAVISDENGMGAAVGDYDNDGDLDWFVSSIHDPNGVAESFWGVSGNRLYQNQGDGTFHDVTTTAGVRQGFWGWGSCFADFDNDGFLDLFHVNGIGYLDDTPSGIWAPGADEFYFDPARLFLSNGDGTFREQAAQLGVADNGQGRGVVCFDFDRDGDIDIFIANNGQGARLYRNDANGRGDFLAVKLRGNLPNREAIGARVYVSSGAQTQMREIRAGSNFESQDPTTAHFGLGRAGMERQVRVVWPDQSATDCPPLAVNQFVTIDQPTAQCRAEITRNTP